jgi:hypothetical protein
VSAAGKRGIYYFIFERLELSYNSRHLAQEDHLKETKTTAQLAKAKSTIRQAKHASLLPHCTDARTRG